MIQLPGDIDRDAQLLDIDRADCEESLYIFVRSGFHCIDPATWIDSWAIAAICDHLEAVADGEIRKLLLNISPRCLKTITTSVCFPAWTWAQPGDGPLVGPKVSFICSSYGRDLSMDAAVKSRQLIGSQWYKDRWGSRFQLSDVQATKTLFVNDKGGRYLSTSVSGGTLGRGADIIIADDLNDAQEALSESSIESTLSYWNTVLRTRLNNPKTGAFVVIQQRLAENDITGHILEKAVEDWCHVMIPMRYEPERSYHTVIGWKDPRTEPGELMWPERFGESEVKSLESDLGPYACNPYEAPILMSDLSLKPIGEVKVGDEIIGFDKKTRTDGKKGRMKLTKALITEVHMRKAIVVKMTLDSGEVIRCTPDHKWYCGKDRGPTRDWYVKVILGRTSLARVCPTKLPDLSPEDQRLAGWVSGFFDGEGSVSLMAKNHGDGQTYRPSSGIWFYQGAGRNLPLCEKLEYALRHFGFDFTYSEDHRKDNKTAACYGYRQYRIKNSGLPTFQRFLHIVQPTKWRDRIISGSYGCNFIQGMEKVVSIEPDGEELVYALTTTTGNYVAWGFASSNSAGQLQQRPEPKGGGIIKREWWKLWESDAYPPMDFILATLDGAYTEDRLNDPSGMIVWGIFSGDVKAQTTRIVGPNGEMIRPDSTYSEFAPRVMCMYAWDARLELHELVEKVAQTCMKMKVDHLLIENKASGISVFQEIRRLYSREKFGVELFDPKSQDKAARLYSVQHLFAEGMIYGPDRPWMERVITQVGAFPRGKHDEFVDLTSMGLRKLRDMGLLIRQPEREADLEAAKVYPGSQGDPLYPV